MCDGANIELERRYSKGTSLIQYFKTHQSVISIWSVKVRVLIQLLKVMGWMCEFKVMGWMLRLKLEVAMSIKGIQVIINKLWEKTTTLSKVLQASHNTSVVEWVMFVRLSWLHWFLQWLSSSPFSLGESRTINHLVTWL